MVKMFMRTCKTVNLACALLVMFNIRYGLVWLYIIIKHSFIFIFLTFSTRQSRKIGGIGIYRSEREHITTYFFGFSH